MIISWCYKIIHVQKIHLECKKSPMDFNVTEYAKLIDVFSDYLLQFSFMKLPFEFWCSVKGRNPQIYKNAIKTLFPFLLHICVSPDFLHILQPKKTHNIWLNVEANMRIQCLLLNWMLKEFTKMQNDTTCLFFGGNIVISVKYVIYANMQ